MNKLNKQEKLDKLVADGLISEEQKERFGQLHSGDLDVILCLVDDYEVKEKGYQEEITALKNNIEILDSLISDDSEKKPAELQPGHEFTFRGENYKFTDRAPKKIRFAGQGLTQEAIAKDEEVLAELIGGNSSLIKKI